jgi:hypothetical protein
MRAGRVAHLLLALLMTLLSALIQDTTVEVASYGGEGPVSEYLYPRPVAGWPAPFLADNPATSVIQQIGVEDDFRPWSFVADIAFWYLTSAGLWLVIRRLSRKA